MLPKNLVYNSKINSASARSFRTNIQPQNGTGPYSGSQTIIINIPTRRNQVLATTESYLRGTLTVTNTTGGVASFRFEKCGIHGIFRRIRVWNGSNELEDHDQYNNMAAMLYDTQMPATCVENKYNILTGSRSERIYSSTIATADGADAATTQALANAIKASLNSGPQVVQRNSGDLVHENLANATASNTYNFAANLISVMGSLCPNVYFPLFACTSAPIRIEIDLVANLSEALGIACTGANTANTSTFTLTNLEYVGHFIELSDEAMSIVTGSIGNEPLQFVITQFKNTSGNLNAGQDINLALPFKYTSLKSIFISQRDNTGAVNRFPFSSNTYGINRYNFRIGSQLLPSKAPDQLPEMYAELLKAIGSISDLQFCPAIDRRTYTGAASTALAIATSSLINNVDSNSFYIGLDLETYSNANKDSIFSGYNSNTDDAWFIANYAANQTIRYDAYAMYDSLFSFQSGIVYRSV